MSFLVRADRIADPKIALKADTGQAGDVEVQPEELAFRLDETNNHLIFYVRYSTGTVKSGTVTLS